MAGRADTDRVGRHVADLIVSTANGGGAEVVSGYAIARLPDPPSGQPAGAAF